MLMEGKAHCDNMLHGTVQTADRTNICTFLIDCTKTQSLSQAVNIYLCSRPRGETKHLKVGWKVWVCCLTLKLVSSVTCAVRSSRSSPLTLTAVIQVSTVIVRVGTAYKMQGTTRLSVHTLSTLWNKCLIDIIFMPWPVQRYSTGC